MKDEDDAERAGGAFWTRYGGLGVRWVGIGGWRVR